MDLVWDCVSFSGRFNSYEDMVGLLIEVKAYLLDIIPYSTPSTDYPYVTLETHKSGWLQKNYIKAGRGKSIARLPFEVINLMECYHFFNLK